MATIFAFPSWSCDFQRHNTPQSSFLSLSFSQVAQPFARTNRTLFSFIPNTISAWNSLPLDVVSAPDISSFKKRLCFSIYILFVLHHTIGYTLYLCIYMYVTISVSMHSKIALSLESAVHKMRNEFELSMDSQRLCSTGIFVPTVAFPVRSRLPFKANDSSYVFKILIGKVVAKRPEL